VVLFKRGRPLGTGSPGTTMCILFSFFEKDFQLVFRDSLSP
jgi:hypothetical protein